MSLFSKVKINNEITKKFSYTKERCSLSFSLRIDMKSDLKDFLELLKVAQKDVEIDIEKLCH